MSWIYAKIVCGFSLSIFILSGCSLTNILSENEEYDFRKVRWGYSKERVALNETDSTLHENSENYLLYKCKINGVHCSLIYTFKDNRLRTAGYLTIAPIPDADDLIKEAVKNHGVPEDTQGEKIWKTPRTMIYAALSPTVRVEQVTKYEYTRSGLVKDAVRNQLPGGKAGIRRYWDGVYTHVDRAFFDQLHEMDLPLADLSFYEKRLMGVVIKARRIYKR